MQCLRCSQLATKTHSIYKRSRGYHIYQCAACSYCFMTEEWPEKQAYLPRNQRLAKIESRIWNTLLHEDKPMTSLQLMAEVYKENEELPKYPQGVMRMTIQKIRRKFGKDSIETTPFGFKIKKVVAK